jgi:hypothetical protein
MNVRRQIHIGDLSVVRKCETPAVLFILLILMAEASAGLLQFTFEGRGSGALEGTLFTNSDFVITAYGYTEDRVPLYSDLPHYGWSIEHSFASISIAGLGDFEFLTGTRTYVNNYTQKVGFSRAFPQLLDLYWGPINEQFADWDMLEPIGPISGSGYLLQWYFINNEVWTTGGMLRFNQVACDATFRAMIPEPLTVLVWCLGGLALRFKRT